MRMPLPHALHFIHAHTHMPSPHNLHFISRTHAHAIATCFALHFTHARACHRHSFCTLFHAHTCKPLPHILHFILRTRVHATATHFALHFKHARTRMPSPLVALHFTHARACHRHSFRTSFYAHACMPPPHILHFISRTHTCTNARTHTGVQYLPWLSDLHVP